MWPIILVCLGVAVLYLAGKHWMDALLQAYQTQNAQNDLASIGWPARQFIGLHIKNLSSENPQARLIYVRKTTPYKEVLLFSPDWKLDFHFYLPWLYQLCRQGYLIVTYHTSQSFTSQQAQDLAAVYDLVAQDPVLKTYPLSLLGHGTGAYASLYQAERLPHVRKTAVLDTTLPEIASLQVFINKHVPFQVRHLSNWLKHHVQKKWQLDLAYEPTQFLAPVLSINGPAHLAEKPLVETYNRSKAGHFSFLTSESQKQIAAIQAHLQDPEISQFEYDKTLEHFDLNLLANLDLSCFEVICQFLQA